MSIHIMLQRTEQNMTTMLQMNMAIIEGVMVKNPNLGAKGAETRTVHLPLTTAKNSIS